MSQSVSDHLEFGRKELLLELWRDRKLTERQRPKREFNNVNNINNNNEVTF